VQKVFLEQEEPGPLSLSNIFGAIARWVKGPSKSAYLPVVSSAEQDLSNAIEFDDDSNEHKSE